MAADSAEGGIAWALDRLYQGPGWRAFATEGDGRFGTGASALLTAALVLRRERTGDDSYDAVIHDLGGFLAAMVNERGQVHGEYDRATGAPVPESWSKYFTGETFWALTLLHRAFPDAGYGDPAARVADYIATQRRDVERLQPDLPDHWAAYGFAVMTTWPDWELPAEYEPYVRRQSGLQSLQIRYESQRTNSFFSYVTRGRQTLGAGLGTIGEALSNWEVVAAATPSLGDIREPLVERARCVGGALVDRQTGPDDVADDDDESIVLGAWFQFDVTQMDDQQHALSALLGAAALTPAEESDRELDRRRRRRAHRRRRAPARPDVAGRAGGTARRRRRRARGRGRRVGVRRHAAARRPRHQLADDGGRRRPRARRVVGGGAGGLGRPPGACGGGRRHRAPALPDRAHARRRRRRHRRCRPQRVVAAGGRRGGRRRAARRRPLPATVSPIAAGACCRAPSAP